MKGDFSRNTFKKNKHYSEVKMQQGRVQVDADWNEQVDIQAHYNRSSLRDIIGETGAPHDKAGFRIEAAGNSYRIGAGHYYVDGILCENETEIDARDQLDFPSFGEYVAVPNKPGVYIVYLDVWERGITYLEDEEIREVALGGLDTATRTKIIWQVKAVHVPDEIKDWNSLISFKAWNTEIAESTGTLQARTQPIVSTPESPGLSRGGGYTRKEDHLYRVEIHNAGEAGNGASFKWSRDNGIVVAKVTDIVDSENKISVSHTGRDSRLGFAPGQWVEITDDRHDLWGIPGTFVQLYEVRDNSLFFKPDTIEAEPITSGKFPLNFNPKVRRWDSPDGLLKATIPSTNDGYTELEAGVQVKFGEGKKYKTGDYWLIPARTATRDIEWPRTGDTPDALLCEGIKHHFCCLALLKYSIAADGGGSFEQISDLRTIFPTVTDLNILYYIGGDGQKGSLGKCLPFPLQAGVAKGNIPVKGAKVQFTATGNDRLGPTPNQLNKKSLVLSTNDEGRVKCYWKLTQGIKPHQVEAVLLDGKGQKMHLPLLYSATSDGTATPTLGAAATMCTHGTAVNAEYPQRLESIPEVGGYAYRRGWGTYFRQRPNSDNWFHFPITSPIILDDVRPLLVKAFVLYNAQNVQVTNIHIWDGRRLVKQFNDLNLTGDHSGDIDSSNSWTIDPPAQLAFGLGISVGARFLPGDLNISQPSEILFTTAGGDFRRP